MLKYIFKRLLALIITIAGGTFIVYMITFTPVDLTGHVFSSSSFERARLEMIEWYRHRGLLDPAWVQYLRYMAGVFRGDFGTSLRAGVPVAEKLIAHLPHTLWLSFAALSFSLLLAVPLGIIAAIKRNTWVDKVSIFIALIGISMPVMWLGVFLVFFVSPHIDWLPSLGAAQLDSVVLPGIALGTAMMAAMIGSIRSSMLEAANKNYIRTARAKGLPKGKTIFKHALPNIITPALASFKVNLEVFFIGLIVIEAVFSRPGISRLMMQSIFNQDIPMFLGCLLMFMFFFALLNFVVDIIKAFADPRMRREYR